MDHHQQDVELPPEEAADALARAAEDWGAEWTPARGGGRLVLPVVFGLRRGVAVGRVDIARLGKGSRLVWQLEESRLEVHRAAVAVLSFAAIPLVATLAWPFHPPLLALAPFAAVMGLLAWWLVVSRLRNSGPEEFFAAVAPVELPAGDAPADR
jgi:hypothetical protein